MHAHTYHHDVLQALYASPAHRIEGLRTLATKVAGTQPSPNAELAAARDVALAAELLALRGLITIDRAPARAAFTLTDLGRNYMRPRAKPAATSLSSAVALTTALSGCTTILSPSATPVSTAPSLEELRQRAPSRIEQVVDPYYGHTYFARCTDCSTPTPKTLATAPTATAGSDITRFMPPDVLARARGAEGGGTSVPFQRRQMSDAFGGSPTFVERRYVVYFKFADGGVDPAAQLALQRIASQLTGAKSILIVGSTDPTGATASNQRLAEQRAKSVSAALAKAGVARAGVETSAQPNRSSGPSTDAVLLGRAAATTPGALARHAEIIALVPADGARVASLSE
ncbi:MAG TPA: OmpA family protein [Burkholderiaceae bacterium]|nr:OmpA family protein [Burkholderiaceae bacterium]